eukprot:NODE_115_length_19014_cov_0.489664.p4 type:complete len:422 gc:universal NODE_115_length_19014_cov_0.489664:14932-13667(-)
MSLDERLHLRALGENRVHAMVDEAIPRYGVSRELESHSGCVNTVTFNESGDLLVSGSDDQCICIWDGYTFSLKDKLHTEHKHNIFSAVLLNDGIVSCCAFGDVLFTNMNGQSEHVFNHNQKMAYQIELVDRHSFMSCGEDGNIQGFDTRMKNYGVVNLVNSTRTFNKENQLSHLQFKHRTTERGIPSISCKDDFEFAAAFNDDFVRIFDRRNLDVPLYSYCPSSLNPFFADESNQPYRQRSGSRITSCQYDPHGSGNLVVSYSDDDVYVVCPELDGYSDPTTNFYKSENTIATLSGHLNTRTMIKECSFLGNNSQFVMCGSDDGRVYIWDIYSQEVVNSFKADEDVVNCVLSHPVIPCLVISGIDHTIKVCYPEHDEFDRVSFEGYLKERSEHAIEQYTLRLPLSELLEMLQRGAFEEDLE